MKTLMILLVVFFCISVFSAEITGKIVSVSDGDTVTVLDAMDNAEFRIRLDKIDAPEKEQDFAAISKKRLTELIHGKTVSVRFKKVDRYGRIVGTVYLDGMDINLEMSCLAL